MARCRSAVSGNTKQARRAKAPQKTASAMAGQARAPGSGHVALEAAVTTPLGPAGLASRDSAAASSPGPKPWYCSAAVPLGGGHGSCTMMSWCCTCGETFC